MSWWRNINWEILFSLSAFYIAPLGVGGYVGYQSMGTVGIFVGTGIIGICLWTFAFFLSLGEEPAGTLLLVLVGLFLTFCIGKLGEWSFGGSGFYITAGAFLALSPSIFWYAMLTDEREASDEEEESEGASESTTPAEDERHIYFCIAGQHVERAEEVARNYSTLLGNQDLAVTPYPPHKKTPQPHRNNPQGLTHHFWSHIGQDHVLISVLEGNFDADEWWKWGHPAYGVVLLVSLEQSYSTQSRCMVKNPEDIKALWRLLNTQVWFQTLRKQGKVALQTLEPNSTLQQDQLHKALQSLGPEFATLPVYRSYWSTPSSFLVALMSLVAQTKQVDPMTSVTKEENERWHNNMEDSLFDG
ncbi:MAG: hypothetical protein EP343_21360 [Deltaproteobacteria bacterium]|nr:MAG: hypothetical protein EP343_21360 [Deltaproteobacteria bacterium]